MYAVPDAWKHMNIPSGAFGGASSPSPTPISSNDYNETSATPQQEEYSYGNYQEEDQSGRSKKKSRKKEKPAKTRSRDKERDERGLVNETMSQGKWIITIILCMIPLVNIISLLVFAICSDYIERRRWARAMLLITAILVGLCIVALVLFGSMFTNYANMLNYSDMLNSNYM